MNEKEYFNPQNHKEARMKFFERFDWTDELLTDFGVQWTEETAVIYHEIFAGHRMNIEMDTEFKVKVTPQKVKAVYRQNLPMRIHLKEDLIV